jgi:ethanolamine ammonia-lyase small subunit
MHAGSRRIPPFLLDLVDAPDAPVGPTPPQLDRAAAEKPPRTVALHNPHNAALAQRIVSSTPSRVATGRAGTRYLTDTYLELREDHAVAKDAVAAALPEDLAPRLGCIPVVSRCRDREQYLLYPNEGRRLSDESRARLAREGPQAQDVVVIVADGLSAPALELNGPRLLPALLAALRSRGLSVGAPILASMARVGLQDDVGVLLHARGTAICLGERPGLGTGDSLSIYIAIGPKLDQDNAEKNCISNIRPQGLSPEAAAQAAAELLRKGLELGRGGLALT